VSLEGCTLDDLSTTGFAGTSGSAPIISGVAALLLSYRPELVGEDIERILNRTADPQFLGGGWTEEFGWGRVRAGLALSFVAPPKVVAHWGAGALHPMTLGPLAVVDSTLISSRTFLDVPGMPATNYTTSCVKYVLRATVTWPFAMGGDVVGWTRSSGTWAWKDIHPYDYTVEVDSAQFVSFSATGATVEAFVFRVRNAADTSQTIGWFPTTPDSVRVAFTVIGTPAGTTAVSPDYVAPRLSASSIPNPGRGRVRIALTVPRRGYVRVTMLDIAGRRVATLHEGELDAGSRQFVWEGRSDDGSDRAAGVYFCRVDHAGITKVSRLVYLGRED
jgi:subtilisin family serine protease